MQRLMRRTAVWTALFTIAAMAVMFYYSSVKVIVIAGERADATQMNTTETYSVYQNGKPLILEENNTSQYLSISLPDGITADNISIDNHYMDKIVEVGIKGVDESYYRKEAPYGQCRGIEESVYYTQNDTMYLAFAVNDIYEVDYVYETGRLSIRFVSPASLYDKIVVLDAGSAYTNEKRQDSIVTEVVGDVRTRLEDRGIKVYDVSAPNGYDSHQKLSVIEKLSADMYVAIEIQDAAGGRSGMEAFYNDTFFIPFVGNITVADTILHEAVVSTDGATNGLLPYESGDAILQNSQIPSTRLRLGYEDSYEDMQKLYEREYRQALAEGIAAGIAKCYDLMAR